MSEENLKAAEIETAKWRSRVLRINEKIREAQAVLDKSEARRAEHALAAATGNETAAAAMTKIRRENENAEKDIADLRLALPEAQRHLTAAEQAESAIRKSITRKAAHEKMRERIEAAAEIDKALADFVQAFAKWTDKGDDIKQLYYDLFGGSVPMNVIEGAFGPARLLAALPPSVFCRLFPSISLGGHQKLAVSEADFWGPAASSQSAAA